jgi:hypothetical protein
MVPEINEERERVGMNKKRIRWSASPSADVVGYRLYWACRGIVDYDSDFVDINHKREIVLPDEVPSLQFAEGRVELGITAVGPEGSESDMARFTVSFGRAIPFFFEALVRPASEGWETPVNTSILVDDLHHWVIRDVPSFPSGGPRHGHDYFINSHHIDEMRR